MVRYNLAEDYLVKALGLIPARGGSKEVPRKNIRPLAGKPLIVYTIEAALQSQHRLRVVVSTDDQAIAETARAAGADAPFLRPPELARDETPMLPVLQHAIKYLKQEEGYYPNMVILLQPTSPLRTTEHIDQAIELFLETRANSVVSLCKVEHSPYWMKIIDVEGRVSSFVKSNKEYIRRQDLPKVYRLNGAIFVTEPDIIMNEGRVLGDDTRAYIMEPEDSIDVDTELDFELAELIIKKRCAKRGE